MKRLSVTSQQVAEYASVSRTTVSLVLNHIQTPNISEQTRQRVLQAAKDLGYIPDATAQALVQGHNRNIGLLICQATGQVFHDPYIPTVLTGITEGLKQQGWRILVENIEDSSQSALIGQMLRSKEIAGAITDDQVYVETTFAAGFKDDFPLVLLNHKPIDGINSISIDLSLGDEELMRHLFAHGHHNIACIPYTSTEKSPFVIDRLNAYKRMLSESNLPYNPALVCFGDYSIETGFDAMNKLLQLRPRPTAVYAMNDTMAIGSMRAIHKAGLRIPDDIAIIGFDDHRFAEWLTPTLTSVHVPWLEQGQLAAEMLLQLINGQQPQKSNIALRPHRIVRESCGSHN